MRSSRRRGRGVVSGALGQTGTVPELPRSFVALGDSFTEGMQDELGPDGRHLGWADRVAAALAIATGGLRYAQPRRPWPPPRPGRRRAAAGGPRTGARPRLVPCRAERRAPAAHRHRRRPAPLRVAPWPGLRAPSGSTSVLLFTVLERAGGTGRTAGRLAARFRRFNDGVRATARRRGALLVDVGPVPRCTTAGSGTRTGCTCRPRAMPGSPPPCSRRWASPTRQLLGGAPGWWREPLPPGPPPRRRADLVADVRWVRRHFLPWVGRRVRGVSSGDGVRPKHTALSTSSPADLPLGQLMIISCACRRPASRCRRRPARDAPSRGRRA